MKRLTFYFAVSILTHLIGFTSVCLVGFLPPVITMPQELPEVREELEVIPVAFNNTKSESLKSLPKFMPTSRGCGNGYSQSYETSDGQWLYEGVIVYENSKQARLKLNKWIAEATKIIERIPNSKNRWGDLGERIVIANPKNEDGRRTFSILWYGGGESVSYIDAPTLELALEFERTNAYAY